MKSFENNGQATIEFIFVLLFMAFLSTQFFRAIGAFVGNNIGSLAYILSNHLSTGVCEVHCVYSGFVNQLGN